MKIVFHGATRTVTGSQHEVQVAGKRILLDCGLFQGPRDLARKINCCFDFDPKTVDAVILSHGHADHCGNLPNLVKQGFKGPIYCTKATAAITAIMLMDSAKIQEEDAGYLNQKKVKSWQGDIQPLYTREDAEATVKLFVPIEYRKPTDLGGHTVEFRDAGHILGSAAISLTETATGRVLVFTGDVGRPGSAVVRDADPFTRADALISECTYGGKTHPPIASVPGLVAGIINATVSKGGLVLMPAFALGRTQAILEQLHVMYDHKQIPGSLQAYVDSPLATRLTDVFRHFPNLMDEETRALTEPFDNSHIHYVASPDESRKLNDQHAPAIIIASSGMCEAGRILHHLKHHIRDPHNTVLLPGFQAEGTLGRKIQEHYKEVPILGDIIPLNARVEMIAGMSAHGDSKELTDYVRPLLNGGNPKVYLVHGEVPSAIAHQATLKAAGFGSVTIPSREDSADV